VLHHLGLLHWGNLPEWVDFCPPPSLHVKIALPHVLSVSVFVCPCVVCMSITECLVYT